MESQPPNFETQLMNQTARGHFVSLVDLTCGRGTATSWTFGYLPNQKPTTIGISLKNHNNDFVYNATATQCPQVRSESVWKAFGDGSQNGHTNTSKAKLFVFQKIFGGPSFGDPQNLVHQNQHMSKQHLHCGRPRLLCHGSPWNPDRAIHRHFTKNVVRGCWLTCESWKWRVWFMR